MNKLSVRKLAALWAAAMFAFGLWQGVKTGTVGAAATFNFESATPAERQHWLDEQAKQLADIIAESLPGGDGTEPLLTLTATRVDARNRSINFDIGVEQSSRLADNAHEVKREMVRTACPFYIASPLGQNAIFIYQNFKRDDGSNVLSLGLTPIVCERETSS